MSEMRRPIVFWHAFLWHDIIRLLQSKLSLYFSLKIHRRVKKCWKQQTTTFLFTKPTNKFSMWCVSIGEATFCHGRDGAFPKRGKADCDLQNLDGDWLMQSLVMVASRCRHILCSLVEFNGLSRYFTIFMSKGDVYRWQMSRGHNVHPKLRWVSTIEQTNCPSSRWCLPHA